MSWRPLRTQAGASEIASSTCWIVGRTAAGGVRRRAGPFAALRARENRCSCSAASSVELQGAREGLEHRPGDPGEVPALQTDVVVDGDPGQHRDLFTPQSLDPTIAAIGEQPGLLGGDPRAPRGEELADFGTVIDRGHEARLGAPRPLREGLAVPGRAGPSGTATPGIACLTQMFSRLEEAHHAHAHARSGPGGLRGGSRLHGDVAELWAQPR